MEQQMSLQLFSELYDIVMNDEKLLKATCEILLDYLKEEDVRDGSDAQAAIYKAFVVALLNDDKLDDMTTYAEELCANDTEAISFVKFEKGSEITEIITSYTNDSIKAFDRNYVEAVLRILIQYNNGTDEIKNALTKYADVLEVSKSKITTSLCSAMAGEEFTSLDDIAKYINDYKDPFSNIGSSSGRPSGGGLAGSGSSGGYYDNKSFENTSDSTVHSETVQVKPFADLAGYEWAETAIENLYKKGVISGKAEKSFCPQDNITREEFSKLVVLGININIKGDDIPFTDVAPTDWYYDYVRTLYAAGVINGVSDTVFGTGTNITRQDAAVMINRAMEKCGLITEEYEEATDFDDTHTISDYALESIAKLKSNGMITGDENNNFNPHTSMTRAEAAVLIYRVYQKAAYAN